MSLHDGLSELKREDMNAALRNFMAALDHLALDHGFVLGGCGCCGSPTIRDMGSWEHPPQEDKAVAGHLQWDEKRNEYTVAIETY